MRTWAKRIGLLAAVGLLAAGGYVATNWTELKANRTAARVPTDPTAAGELLALGEAGFQKVPGLLRSADAATADAIREAVRPWLAAAPVGFPAALVGGFAEYSPAGQAAVLSLLPDLQIDDDTRKTTARTALTSADAGVRIVVVKLAPKLGLTAEAAALATDPTPEVRAAALVAAGPGVDEETLFRLLHDSAEPVRAAAEGVLLAGGRSETDIALGRRLSSPSAAERLRLVPDLLAGQARDPGPWLERLARDPVPAVRAAAARAAADLSLPFAPWVDQLAADDPDPAVRAVARFHRGRLGNRLTPVGGP